MFQRSYRRHYEIGFLPLGKNRNAEMQARIFRWRKYDAGSLDHKMRRPLTGLTKNSLELS